MEYSAGNETLNESVFTFTLEPVELPFYWKSIPITIFTIATFQDYYMTTLIATVLYTVLAMPERVTWWVHTFYPFNDDMYVAFGLLAKLGFVAVALVWLFVPRDIREGYKKVCCCCCHKEEKDEEEVELLK